MRAAILLPTIVLFAFIIVLFASSSSKSGKLRQSCASRCYLSQAKKSHRQSTPSLQTRELYRLALQEIDKQLVTSLSNFVYK